MPPIRLPSPPPLPVLFLSPVSPVVHAATSCIAAARITTERDGSKHILDIRVLADPAHNDCIRHDRVRGGQ